MIWVKTPPVHSRLSPDADTSEQLRPDVAIARLMTRAHILDWQNFGIDWRPRLPLFERLVELLIGSPERGFRVENACDGYHLAFVHASTFGVADSAIGKLYGGTSTALTRDYGGPHRNRAAAGISQARRPRHMAGKRCGPS